MSSHSDGNRERAGAAHRGGASAFAESLCLGPYLFTDSVRIEAGAVPHSRPRLTLHTRYRDDPDRLLALFLHEQMHWAVSMDDGLHRRLVGLIPGLPAHPPDGAGTPRSTYLHLLVCAGERMALGQLLGPATADALIRRIAEERYRAVYAAVLERGDEILDEARRAGLTFRRED